MTTPRLGLSELIQNQSQPHVPINTSERRLDALVQCVALDRDLDTPPGTNADGDSYIVAPTGATGAWVGLENHFVYYAGGWESVAPFEGMRVDVLDEGIQVRYSADSPGSWIAAESGGGSGGGGGGPAEIIFDQSIAANPGAAVDNYNPAGWNGGDGKNRLVITPNAGGTTMNGLDASNVPDGWAVALCNADAAESLTIPNEAGSSTAANRFEGPAAGDVVLLPKQCKLILRVGGRWRFLT